MQAFVGDSRENFTRTEIERGFLSIDRILNTRRYYELEHEFLKNLESKQHVTFVFNHISVSYNYLFILLFDWYSRNIKYLTYITIVMMNREISYIISIKVFDSTCK